MRQWLIDHVYAFLIQCFVPVPLVRVVMEEESAVEQKENLPHG